MKVLLRGNAIDVVAFPRFALHQNQVYTITKESKLRRLTLDDIKYQGSLVLIGGQLQTGDKIITSDIFPAVDGMGLTPILDDITTAQMIEWLGANK